MKAWGKKTQIYAEGENSPRCEIPEQVLVKQPDLKSETENKISEAPYKSRNSLNAKKIRLASNVQKQHAKQRWLKRQDSPRPPRPAPGSPRRTEHCKGWMSLDPLTTASMDGRLENK